MNTEKITISDAYDFRYEITVEHFPHLGFSQAVLHGTIICQVERNRLHEPTTDNDREWEGYEEMFAEWKDSIMTDLIEECKIYLNDY